MIKRRRALPVLVRLAVAPARDFLWELGGLRVAVKKVYEVSLSGVFPLPQLVVLPTGPYIPRRPRLQ